MKSWFWRVIVAAASLLTLAAGQAGACSCATLGPAPCMGLRQGSDLFVGTVVDIENPPTENPRDQGGESRYHFRIDEVISGVSGTEVDVYSGRGGGDCSYHFQKDKQYLVTPHRDGRGRLVATICSKTRPAELASALLPQLRAMRDGRRVANIFGILRRTQQPYESVQDDTFDRPLAHMAIELRAEGHTHKATTDASGRFELYDVPAGTYSVWADLPRYLELSQTILDDPLPPLELPDGACFEYDLEALPTGRIRGSVIGPDGHRLRSASVELFRVERYDPGSKPVWFGWREFQGDKDFFEFNHVAPGKYVLVFNNRNLLDSTVPFPRTFHPGVVNFESAGIIDLQEGQQMLDADIHVAGGRATRQLVVRVVWNDSDPPKNVYLTAAGSEGRPPFAERVAPGVFRITLLRAVLYRIFAHQDCGLRWEGNTGFPIGRVETESVIVDGSDDRTSEVTLVYRGRGCPLDAKPYSPLPRP